MKPENRIQNQFFRDLMWENLRNAFQRTAEPGGVRFGLARNDEPGAVEDVVDTIANYGGRLMSLRTSRSLDQVYIYVTTAGVAGNVPALREELGGLGEILYFRATHQGSL